MRQHLARCPPILDRLVSILPERHPGDLSWPTLYGLTLLAILAGDLAGRLGFGLAVLPAIAIAFLVGLRRDSLASFVLAAGLLGSLATASGQQPAAAQP